MKKRRSWIIRRSIDGSWIRRAPKLTKHWMLVSIKRGKFYWSSSLVSKKLETDRWIKTKICSQNEMKSCLNSIVMFLETGTRTWIRVLWTKIVFIFKQRRKNYEIDWQMVSFVRMIKFYQLFVQLQYKITSDRVRIII